MNHAQDLLDAVDSAQPQPWWKRRIPATALQLASAALEECRRDQLVHAQGAEYHAAMVAMLKLRDKRLQADLRRLSATQIEQPLPTHGQPAASE
jgi:adenine-specific DNA methylase